MTALAPGDTWFVIGGLAFFAAAAGLSALMVYLVLTARQDREERTRPERRRWVSIEEANARTRLRESKVGLAFVITAILVILVLTVLGA